MTSDIAVAAYNTGNIAITGVIVGLRKGLGTSEMNLSHLEIDAESDSGLAEGVGDRGGGVRHQQLRRHQLHGEVQNGARNLGNVTFQPSI